MAAREYDPYNLKSADNLKSAANQSRSRSRSRSPPRRRSRRSRSRSPPKEYFTDYYRSRSKRRINASSSSVKPVLTKPVVSGKPPIPSPDELLKWLSVQNKPTELTAASVVKPEVVKPELVTHLLTNMTAVKFQQLTTDQLNQWVQLITPLTAENQKAITENKITGSDIMDVIQEPMKQVTNQLRAFFQLAQITSPVYQIALAKELVQLAIVPHFKSL